jgi:Ribbon-helix-helix domain
VRGDNFNRDLSAKFTPRLEPSQLQKIHEISSEKQIPSSELIRRALDLLGGGAAPEAT